MFRMNGVRAPGWVLRLVAVVLAMALSACGGGGGGGDSAAAPAAPPPNPPGAAIVTVTSSPALVGDTVTLVGQASGGRAPYRYAWTFGDGTSADAETASHSYETSGQYPVTFSVTDANGLRASATSTVIIESRTGLNISLPRSAFSVGQTVRLSATGLLSTVQGLDWDLGDGRTATGPYVDVVYPARGVYPVTLSATYANGLRRTAATTINVSSDAPSLNIAAPDLIYPQQTAIFTTTPATISRGQVVHWDFGDGSPVSAWGGQAQHAFALSGTYQVTAELENETGARVKASMSVTVLPPLAPSGLTMNNWQVSVGPRQGAPEVTFDGNVASGPGNFGTTYVWDFGDGSTSPPGPSGWIKHRYAAAGTYTARLTATNLYGLSASGTATISVAPRQTLSLLAGRGVADALVDGPGTVARFSQPDQMSFDAAGNLFISDAGNAVVRKMTPQGVVSTVTLPGDACWYRNDPRSFSLAAFGNGGLVSVDRNCGSFIRLEPDGSSRRDYRFSTTSSEWIFAIARNADGAVALASSASVRRIEPDDRIAPLAGKLAQNGTADGLGEAARFSWATRLPLGYDAAGMLYVADSRRVRKVAPDGTVTTLAGSDSLFGRQDGQGDLASFNAIDDIAVAPDGTVYALDSTDARIRKVSPTGAVTTLPVSLALPPGTNSQSAGIALGPDGTLVVSDRRANIIRRINADNSLTVIAGQMPVYARIDGQGAAAAFWDPQGIVQGPSGALYVADSRNRALRKITLGGEVTTLAVFPSNSVQVYGTHPYQRTGIPSLGGIAVDDQENVYIADAFMNVIRKVTPDGTSTVLAGEEGTMGYANGTTTQARFYSPLGVAVDAARNVYVVDSFNQAIRKITPAGQVSTIAGLPGYAGYRDGTGSGAYFGFPSELTAAPDGTLWVGDFGNQTIRKITPAGVVTTVAGRQSTFCNIDGPLGTNCAQEMFGMSYDATTGDVYVASASYGIQRLRADGWYETLVDGGWGGRIVPGTLPAGIGEPRGVAVLSNGQLALTTGQVVLITSFGP